MYRVLSVFVSLVLGYIWGSYMLNEGLLVLIGGALILGSLTAVAGAYLQERFR